MGKTVEIVSEAGMLNLAMMAETEPGKRARAEIAAIVMAWKRGYLLPKTEAPMLDRLYDLPNTPPPKPSPLRVVD